MLSHCFHELDPRVLSAGAITIEPGAEQELSEFNSIGV
jgi:hypothetical protein